MIHELISEFLRRLFRAGARRAGVAPSQRRRSSRAGRRSSRGSRIFVAIAFPLISVPLFIWGALSIGPAISATFGHGIRGSFVAQTESCGKGGCSWDGTFTSDNGRDRRQNVTFDGSYPGMADGISAPALDTGAPLYVYGVGDHFAWFKPAAMVVVPLVMMGSWVRMFLLPVLARRRRFGEAAPFAGPYTGSH